MYSVLIIENTNILTPERNFYQFSLRSCVGIGIQTHTHRHTKTEKTSELKIIFLLVSVIFKNNDDVSRNKFKIYIDPNNDFI